MYVDHGSLKNHYDIQNILKNPLLLQKPDNLLKDIKVL